MRVSLENVGTAISFNFLSVHHTLCRYKWHACQLTCTDKFLNVPTNFQMYRQKSEKALLGGGGGQLPPLPPPPPSGYASALGMEILCLIPNNNCWVTKYPAVLIFIADILKHHYGVVQTPFHWLTQCTGLSSSYRRIGVLRLAVGPLICLVWVSRREFAIPKPFSTLQVQV